MFKASNGIAYPDGSVEVDVHDHATKAKYSNSRLWTCVASGKNASYIFSPYDGKGNDLSKVNEVQ